MSTSPPPPLDTWERAHWAGSPSDQHREQLVELTNKADVSQLEWV